MKKKLLIVISMLSVILISIAILVYTGVIWFNQPNKEKYQVKGIDVSNHQGIIDWTKVKGDKYEFAYIKATEGSDFMDKSFDKNWIEASKAGLKRGAYHFLTFKSKGVDQAKNFINTVPIDSGSLPPVVDIEFGGNSKMIPEKESFKKEIRDYVDMVEKRYRKTPILYITYETYKEYIKDSFNDCRFGLETLSKLQILMKEKIGHFGSIIIEEESVV